MTAASPPIAATLDHVAVAVPDLDTAERRWADRMGGRVVMGSEHATFRNRQLRFRGGGKLELLAPAGPGDGEFVDRFLQRFGVRVHHVTLKVPDLRAAVRVVAAAGLDVVDVVDDDPAWREGFLRPSQVGGLVVQLAETNRSDEQWAEELGLEIAEPDDDAAVLHGALLGHPHLEEAAATWSLLGADVAGDRNRLTCTWPGAPHTRVVVPADEAGPVALRCTGTRSDLDLAAGPVVDADAAAAR